MAGSRSTGGRGVRTGTTAEACFVVVRWLVALFVLVGTASASAQPTDNRMQIVMLGDSHGLFMKTLNPPVDGRWIGLEVSSAQRFGLGQSTRFRPLYKQNMVVDCSNRGMARMTREINVEEDREKVARWALDPDYQQHSGRVGINDLTYRPVEELVEEEFDAAMRGPNAQKRAMAMVSRGKWPADELLAVEFGCAVVQRGMSPTQAAEHVSSSLGLPDTKTVVCRTDSGERGTERPIELTVRFSERMGYVQLNGTWLGQKSVTADRVWLKMGDVDVSISRLSGRMVLKLPPDVGFEGECQPAQSRRF